MASYNGGQLSRYGAVAKALPFTVGKIFFVLKSSEAWYAEFERDFPVDLDGEVRVFGTVLEAYNATTTGRNDVIVIDSNSTHSLAAMLTVSKNRVNFVSVEWLAGVHRTGDQRCKVSLGVTTAITDVAAVKVTGNGCSFRGIKFINSNTLAQSVTCFQDESPNGLLVEHCSVHSTGSAQLTATGGSALRLAGDGSEYRDSQIGADTILNTVANQVVHISTINSAVAKRVTFRNCDFHTYSSATTHVFVKAPDASGSIDRYVKFIDCNYFNFATTDGSGVTLAVAFESELTAGGHIYVSGGSAFGVTDFATAAVGNGKMQVNMVVPTAGTSGVAVQPTA